MSNKTPTRETKATRQAKSDPLRPSLGLLVKLGSIAVHCEEMLSPLGHGFDKIATEGLLNDPEVKSWIKSMGAFMPVKR